MSRANVTTELVPLADRLKLMQLARVVVVVVTLANAAATPRSWSVGLDAVGLLAAAFLGLTGLGYVAWTLWPGRGITLFGGMLIVDGFFLATMTHLAGGLDAPVAYLVLPHCMMVALLASYRTAAKIALWHSLLAIGVHHAIGAGLLASSGPGSGDPVGLAAFTVLTWLAALGTATFGAMNERELRRRRVDLEDLARMATALESVNTPAEVGRILSESLIDAYGFKTVVVIAVDGDRLVPIAGTAGLAALDPTTTSPAGHVDEVVGKAWTVHATQLVGGVHPGADPFLYGLMGARTNLLVTPLFADGRAIGAVVAEHGLRTGSRIERRVVSTTERFCGHAALALRNAWLLEELQHVAATDGLTGIANRRTFEQSLQRELERAARGAEPVALVMVDVDHFKEFNDTHGHRTGDAALQAVAATLVHHTREYDVVARYGGEEFAVVLPGCSDREAVAMAERLRTAVATITGCPPVTASLGVAVHAGGGGTEVLVRAADAALYEAKRLGRNRVAVAPPMVPAPA